MMDNKRKNSRVPFHATITLNFPNRQHEECETVDLSLKGVFVVGITDHAIGEKCQASLRLIGSTSDLTLDMKGEVVRVEKNGMGLHFFETDLDSFFHLKNILYYNSENPDMMENEMTESFEPYQSID
jgi:hypothetical protein